MISYGMGEKSIVAIAEALDAGIDVADLSFIGLASLAPVFACLCAPGSVFIGLVKPQFESRHDETDARGVVHDESVRQRTVAEVRQALEEAGFKCTDVMESSIRGRRAGNIEYLVRAIYQVAGAL